MNTIKFDWDSVTEKRSYVEYELNHVKVTFIGNNPVVRSNTYNGVTKDQWVFEVIDLKDMKAKLYTVTSILLMRLLKDLGPLDLQSFDIGRVGAGKGMTYQVVKYDPVSKE